MGWWLCIWKSSSYTAIPNRSKLLLLNCVKDLRRVSRFKYTPTLLKRTARRLCRVQSSWPSVALPARLMHWLQGMPKLHCTCEPRFNVTGHKKVGIYRAFAKFALNTGSNHSIYGNLLPPSFIKSLPPAILDFWLCVQWEYHNWTLPLLLLWGSGIINLSFGRASGRCSCAWCESSIRWRWMRRQQDTIVIGRTFRVIGNAFSTMAFKIPWK